MKEIHRGYKYVAQNGYGFHVLLGSNSPNWQVLISLLIKRADSNYSKAAELGAA